MRAATDRVRPGVVAVVALLTVLATLVAIPGNAQALPIEPPLIVPDVFTDDNGLCEAADGDCTLREAIMYANDSFGDWTINLAAGTYSLTVVDFLSDDETGDLDVWYDKNITIVGLGAGATIDASGLDFDRVFEVYPGATLTLDNVTVTGGSAFYGGGIYNNWGTVELFGSAVVENWAYANGGGIYNDGGAVLVANNPLVEEGASSVDNNYAEHGGGIYSTIGEGGNATVTVTGSSVTNNRAQSTGNEGYPYNGGGIYNDQGTVELTDSGLHDNTAQNDGGGLYTRGGTVNFFGSLATDNMAGFEDYGDGGGIWSWFGDVSLLPNEAGAGSGVFSNEASGNGGGIYNENGTLTATDSFIGKECVAEEPCGGNDAAYDGGGVYNIARLPVAEPLPALARTNVSAPVVLTNTVVEHNYAYMGNGGGIYSAGENASVDILAGSSVNDNEAEYDYFFFPDTREPAPTARVNGDSGGNGGGVYLEGGSLSVDASFITDNDAISASGLPFANARSHSYGYGNGGGVFNWEGDVSLTGGTVVSGNFADGNAVLAAERRPAPPYGNGGGLYNYNGTLSVDASEVSGNYAYWGGGIFNGVGMVIVLPVATESTVTLTDSSVVENHAHFGGGIYNGFPGATVNAAATHVDDNEAAQLFGEPGYGYQGGGIYNFEGDVNLSEGSTVDGNSAWIGGGVYNVGFGGLSNGEVVATATVEPTGNLAIADGSVSGNIAANLLGPDGIGYVGGGIYNEGGFVHVSRTTVDGNDATYGGGGIYNSGRYGNGFGASGRPVDGVSGPGVVVVIDSTISNNTTDSAGGGVYNGAFLEAINSTVSGNSAEFVVVEPASGRALFEVGGGGIYNEAFGTVELYHATITDNFTNSYGGGIWTRDLEAGQPAPQDRIVLGGVSLGNSILSGNYLSDAELGDGPECYGYLNSNGGNVFGDTGFDADVCVEPAADPLDLVDTDADLGPLADNGGSTLTHLPAVSSPAVDLDELSDLEADQRGVERPQRDAFDAGAVEVENTPPAAVNDAYAMNEADTPTALVVAAPGVLGNDTDADGDSLTAIKVTDPGHGTLVLNANGSFSYTPALGFLGDDTFTYTASDGFDPSNIATVTITVKDIGVLGAGVFKSHNVGLHDPATGQWHMRTSTGATVSFYFGNPQDVPFVGDWDGDGIDTPGLYRRSDGTVYLRNSNSGGIADIWFKFGNPGDFPIPGDWDGDGKDTVGLYRPNPAGGPGTMYFIDSLGSGGAGLGAASSSALLGTGVAKAIPYNRPADLQVFSGDFDGNGTDSVALYDRGTSPTPGFAWIWTNILGGQPQTEIWYGNGSGDSALAGDWNAMGIDAPGVFRPNGVPTVGPGTAGPRFYLRFTTTQGVGDEDFLYQPWAGAATGQPVSGYWGLG